PEGIFPARPLTVATHPGVLPLGITWPGEEALLPQNGHMRIAFVASAIPRRCGIATFTADLMAAVKAADPAVRCVAAAIDEPNAARAYGPDVRWRIQQDDKESFRAAARLLAEVYGISQRPVVIQHGMPAIVPRGRRRLKRQLGMDHRTIVSTFGLVDPRKGLEYMIAAMPEIVRRHPNAFYLIVGQTHPELLKKDGERYRNELARNIESSGMSDHVRFVNQYLTQREIVDYLLATDVYVTPYLDLNQITSGTLAYALGAGKAIVSTRYLHAAEALADGRGLLVDVRDPDGLAKAVLAILDDPALKGELERRAYDYGKEMAWPNVGRRVLALTRELLEPQPVSPLLEPVDTESP